MFYYLQLVKLAVFKTATLCTIRKTMGVLERRGKAELASFQADPSTNQATTGRTVADPVRLNARFRICFLKKL